MCLQFQTNDTKIAKWSPVCDLLASRCPAPTAALLTRLVTRPDFCCCAPKSRKAPGSPVLQEVQRGSESVSIAAQAALAKHTRLFISHLSHRPPPLHILHPLRLSWRVSLGMSRRGAPTIRLCPPSLRAAPEAPPPTGTGPLLGHLCSENNKRDDEWKF